MAKGSSSATRRTLAGRKRLCRTPVKLDRRAASDGAEKLGRAPLGPGFQVVTQEVTLDDRESEETYQSRRDRMWIWLLDKAMDGWRDGEGGSARAQRSDGRGKTENKAARQQDSKTPGMHALRNTVVRSFGWCESSLSLSVIEAINRGVSYGVRVVSQSQPPQVTLRRPKLHRW